MNKKELVNKVLKFWLKVTSDFDSKQLKKDIEKNLSNIDGIDQEIDYIRIEVDCISDNDLYNELEEIWNELNYYKSNFEKENFKSVERKKQIINNIKVKK